MVSFLDTLMRSQLGRPPGNISVLAIAKAAGLRPPVSVRALIRLLQAPPPPIDLPGRVGGATPTTGNATLRLALNVGTWAQNRMVTLKSVEWTLTEVSGTIADKVSGTAGANRATALYTRQLAKAGKWIVQAKVDFEFQPSAPAPPGGAGQPGGGAGQPPARTSRTVAGPTDPQPIDWGPGMDIRKGFLLEMTSSPNDPTDIFSVDDGVF